MMINLSLSFSLYLSIYISLSLSLSDTFYWLHAMSSLLKKLHYGNICIHGAPRINIILNDDKSLSLFISLSLSLSLSLSDTFYWLHAMSSSLEKLHYGNVCIHGAPRINIILNDDKSLSLFLSLSLSLSVFLSLILFIGYMQCIPH